MKHPRLRNWLTSSRNLLTGTALICSTVLLASGLHASAAPPADDIARQKAYVDSLAASNKETPQLADALYDLGVKYNNARDFANAEVYFRKSLAVEEAIKRKDTFQRLIDAHTGIALALVFQRKFPEAKAEYETVINITKEHGDPKNLPGLYSNMAQLLRKAGNPDESEKYALEGLKLCDAKENPQARAALLNFMGMRCGDAKRLSEGIGYMEESTKLLADGDDENMYFSALRTLAAYQSRLGQLNKSNATYEQLIERVSSPPDPKLLMAAHLGLAENCLQQGKVQAARKHYMDALDQSKSAKAADEELMQTLNGLGSVEADLEHFSEAEKYHDQAMKLAISTDNKSGELAAMIQLGTDYLLQGKPESALEGLQKAEKKSNDQKDPIIRAEVLTVLGRCYRELGQKDAAIGYYQNAIRLYQEGQRPDLQATALNSLATLYLDDHELPKFEDLYKQAKEIYSGIHDQHEEARLDYTLAQSKLLQDKPLTDRAKEAIPLYQSALNKLDGTGDSGMQSAVLRGLGLAYYYNQEYAKSLDAQLRALAASGDSGSLDTQWSCNLGVGKAYKALGKYPEAEPYLRKAVAVVEQERSNLSRDSFKTYNLDLRKDCFFELVDLLNKTNRAYDAIEIAERGKSRAFLDMLANRKERRLDTAFNQNPSPKGAPNQAGQVLIASADIGSRGISVTGRPSETIEETALSPENAKPPTIDEIRDTVKRRNSTCVEYLTTRDKLYTWVISPDGSIFMPPASDLPKDFYQGLSDGFRAITSNAKDADEIRMLGLKRQQHLHRLYDVLIKPIESHLPKDKDAMVTLVPHGPLFCVPFAALMAPDGTYLVENHTLSYAPAIGVLRATQKLALSSTNDQHKLLAFGNPITQRIAFLGALPYAEKEVKEIASLFPQGSATMEIGGDATKMKFLELVPTASEIHLATHGLVDEEHPMRSALVLAPTSADDGLLTVSDIITMKNLKAKMVVLSACQTGRGKITGDGVVGLSRAFIIAGTPSVLVSQWNVDDIMTEYQMRKFYDMYLKGSDKAKSLRDAQLATIAALENRHEGESISDPNFVRANPRLWAAFQLIGESK